MSNGYWKYGGYNISLFDSCFETVQADYVIPLAQQTQNTSPVYTSGDVTMVTHCCFVNFLKFQQYFINATFYVVCWVFVRLIVDKHYISQKEGL